MYQKGRVFTSQKLIKVQLLLLRATQSQTFYAGTHHWLGEGKVISHFTLSKIAVSYIVSILLMHVKPVEVYDHKHATIKAGSHSDISMSTPSVNRKHKQRKMNLFYFLMLMPILMSNNPCVA